MGWQGSGELSGQIIRAANAVHGRLGPGLLESAYEVCLAYELSERGHKVERQRRVPLRYKGVSLDCGFRLDLLVDDAVIVELKATDGILPIHVSQAITYLRLTGKEICLILNFNVRSLGLGGIRRIVLCPNVLRDERSMGLRALPGRRNWR